MARGALSAVPLAPTYARCMSTTRVRLRRARLTAWSFLIVLGITLAACGDETPQGAVHVSRLADDIGPVSENFIDRALDRAEEEGAIAWVLMLDTPGGLITSTDEIVQRILAAEVPVVVFVSPAGARAASAGTFITMASHIAAMAPQHADRGGASRRRRRRRHRGRPQQEDHQRHGGRHSRHRQGARPQPGVGRRGGARVRLDHRR